MVIIRWDSASFGTTTEGSQGIKGMNYHSVFAVSQACAKHFACIFPCDPLKLCKAHPLITLRL